MFRHILVPLDGSTGAERAIPVAASLARTTSGSLVFLHIVATATALECAVARSHTSSTRTEAIEKVMTDAATYLATLSVRYAQDLAHVSTEMDIAFGTASPTLTSTARLEHVDLIVLCRHQETSLGHWGLESVAQQVMRHSPVPFLMINEHEKDMPVLDGTHPLRVWVPLDGSLFAETALPPALQLLLQCAKAGQRELYLLHVVDLLAGEGTGDEETHMSRYIAEQARQNAEHYLQAIEKRLKTDCGSEVQITCLVTSGVDVASTLLKQIALTQGSEQTASPFLIALATHGREGIERLRMGSIAEHLLHSTTIPLLTVCPKEAMARQINGALPVPGKK